MKILLSWLLDHIESSVSNIDVNKLVHLFNIRTAEIESFERVALSYTNMFIGTVTLVDKAQINLACIELQETISLPYRSDAVVGSRYLIYKDNQNWRWVLLSDFCKEKDGIMPAVFVEESQLHGQWRTQMPTLDYVLDVDNKSINHRPDLWGHYGIAREVAAFFDLPLKKLDDKINHQKIVSYAQKSNNKTTDGLNISIEDTTDCSRFAANLCHDVVYKDSMLSIAIRLALVGIKPINAMVDLTNYVMLDVGHPMHVFDACAFAQGDIVVRLAKNGEHLQLLDGQSVTLTHQDLVVANDTKAVSLAGIIGGKDSSYQQSTQSIVLEAAGFDAAVIRKAAQRYKIRTEACMRFEKELDPMQNVIVLQRFLFLAEQAGLLKKASQYPIVSVGKVIEAQTCTLTHSFLQSRLGMDISVEFVQQALQKIGFVVTYDAKSETYSVVVPTYRATKDINIAEDIVEEVIRFYGFENIQPSLPMRQTIPFSLQTIQNIRSIKRALAYGLGMHEVRDYMLYDAAWIARLPMDLVSSVRVKSPLSENWTTLVTSLIPHLLKSIEQNNASRDHLRFFEFNRIWSKGLNGFVEKKNLAGVIYDKKQINFYDSKAELQKLWDTLGLSVVYMKPQSAAPVWYDQTQVAQVFVQDVAIGFIGMLSATWSHQIIDGSAFIFELDGQFLEDIKPSKMVFRPWSKYQDVSYDISLFVPFELNSKVLCDAIQQAHTAITDVTIVDFFEKDEWTAHRAVTVRYTMSDFNKTMTKSELETIVQAVHEALKRYHVHIR